MLRRHRKLAEMSRLAVCSLRYWSLACEEWKQGHSDVDKRGESGDRKGRRKKKEERSKLRKLLGLMIVLPAADMGSAFCFTCSMLIVTSLHSCCHRNQEQRQNKTAVKSRAQTREAEPYTLFKSYFVNGRSILRQKQQEGRGEGRVVRNKSSLW